MKKGENKTKKVAAAISGGVDSSVAATLLKRAGYQVIGLFMKLWAEGENRCCDIESLESARAVAARLDIPFYVVNFKEEFKKYVVLDYFTEYSKCRTPNPCVLCNRFIKFDLLLQKAFSLGADYLATGHYCRLRRKSETLNPKSKINSKSQIPSYKLFTAKDKTKDQSYFLWALNQGQLRHVLFPIGDYTKKEVRTMAKKWGLPVYNRKESQGLCFLGNLKAKEFLRQKLATKPGLIKDLNGNILGKHSGLPFYTIGQRRGLNDLRLKNDELSIKGETPPLYVVRQNTKTNTLYVGKEKELYQKKLAVSNVNWISGSAPKFKNISARIRYGHPAIKSELRIKGGQLRVIFDRSVRAITPGQSIVFYHREEMLGGGIISD